MEVRSALLLVMMWGHALASDAAFILKRATANDTQLAYIESGKGDPIVFIHGELEDYRTWIKHMEFFESDYRVIAYSRRNHYPDTTIKDGVADSAVDVHAADLAAFLTSLNLKSAHIVAHSSGAQVALFFAADHPEMVRTLSLNEPPAVGLLRTSPVGLQMRQALEAKLAPSRDAFRNGQFLAGAQLYMDALCGSGSYADLSDEMQRAMIENAPSHVADLAMTTSPALFSCDLARRVRAPTLLISGSRSQPMFQRINDELNECLPDNEQVKITATHAVPTTNQRAFDKAVRAFIEKRGG